MIYSKTMNDEVAASEVYCIYCSGIFSLGSSLMNGPCSRHPHGYKAGKHLCHRFVTISDRIKDLKKRKDEK